MHTCAIICHCHGCPLPPLESYGRSLADPAAAAVPPQDLGFNDVGFTAPLGSQPEALTPFMDNLVVRPEHNIASRSSRRALF